jgi:hypothetical protein
MSVPLDQRRDGPAERTGPGGEALARPTAEAAA